MVLCPAEQSWRESVIGDNNDTETLYSHYCYVTTAFNNHSFVVACSPFIVTAKTKEYLHGPSYRPRGNITHDAKCCGCIFKETMVNFNGREKECSCCSSVSTHRNCSRCKCEKAPSGIVAKAAFTIVLFKKNNDIVLRSDGSSWCEDSRSHRQWRSLDMWRAVRRTLRLPRWLEAHFSGFSWLKVFVGKICDLKVSKTLQRRIGTRYHYLISLRSFLLDCVNLS